MQVRFLIIFWLNSVSVCYREIYILRRGGYFDTQWCRNGGGRYIHNSTIKICWMAGVRSKSAPFLASVIVKIFNTSGLRSHIPLPIAIHSSTVATGSPLQLHSIKTTQEFIRQRSGLCSKDWFLRIQLRRSFQSDLCCFSFPSSFCPTSLGND